MQQKNNLGTISRDLPPPPLPDNVKSVTTRTPMKVIMDKMKSHTGAEFNKNLV